MTLINTYLQDEKRKANKYAKRGEDAEAFETT